MEFNSAGIIPLIKEEGQWKVFLIQNRYFPEYWSCPKGQMESGEAPESTARRELTEETNLKVRQLLQPYPLLETFQFVKDGRKIQKNVLFYVAEVEGAVILQKEEALDGKWLTLAQAVAITKHPEGKATLLRVEKILAAL